MQQQHGSTIQFQKLYFPSVKKFGFSFMNQGHSQQSLNLFFNLGHFSVLIVIPTAIIQHLLPEFIVEAVHFSSMSFRQFQNSQQFWGSVLAICILQSVKYYYTAILQINTIFYILLSQVKIIIKFTGLLTQNQIKNSYLIQLVWFILMKRIQ